MKHLLLSILLFICTTSSWAQELSVKEFREVTNDLSARTKPRQDNNGDDCALVKVQLVAASATFTGNVIGNVAFKNNEYWVYMTAGSKRLKVNHPSYLPLEVFFADYNISQLTGKSTYILTLIMGDLPQGVQQQRVQTGWILMDSEPQGASVYINDEFVGNTPLDGYKQPYGTYTYRVEHPSYHPSSGTIELNTGRLEKKVTLQPAFGAISVKSNISGATVMLDGKATGLKTPCTLKEVASGQHTITLQMEKYAPRQTKVQVEDGKIANLDISLDARFAKISITSLKGAQIFCNGKQIGTTKVNDDMMEGYYDIEARLAHYKTVTKQIQVAAGQPQEIILNPIPIYGTLDITSTPRDADITIDGKPYGKTPLTVEQLLEGEHKVIVSKEGLVPSHQIVSVRENENFNLSVQLNEGMIIQVGEGESLTTILNRITGNPHTLIIKGHLDKNDDIIALLPFCLMKHVKTLNMSELRGIAEIRDIFRQVTGLTSIMIPEGVTTIGNRAFEGCRDLTSITIPTSVTIIGDGAFRGCVSLTSITIPESVTTIYGGAFSGCTSLTSITIPKGVTSIGEYAFSGCTGLTSITIPEGITTIGNGAFRNCTSLTSITIPEGVTTIGFSAFNGCSGLTSITIPESVTRIDGGAFRYCRGLTSITIPESATQIAPNVFEGCNNVLLYVPKGKKQFFEAKGYKGISRIEER